MSHGLSLTHPRDTTVLLSYCPTLLFVMTFLLAALQPEFNIKEVCVCRMYSTRGYVVSSWCFSSSQLLQSVNLVLFGGSIETLPDDIILAAW